MKKIDLGQTITILANVGVIAGIVFLGVELRQNNELMAADARFNLLSARTESFTIQAVESELAAILIKDRNREPLTEVEDLRIQAYWTRVFRVLEWSYFELPNQRGWAEGQRKNYSAYSSYRRAWQGDSGGPLSSGKSSFDPEFVQFVEENVVNER